jgi:argininosuccinate synthase
VSFGVLAPDLRVLAPVRDPGIPREKAIALAGEWGIPISTVATAYSIDENLWGRTAECGPLEDPWVAAPEDAFERTASPEDRPVGPSEVVVACERGVPVALDGTTRTLPDLIRTVDALGGRYGFGRVDMLENRRVGIKSRELYEVPGALALIAAHRALEDLTLEREVAHHKPGLEQRWSELVYDGLWFSPLRQAIDAYVDATQEHVTGEVRLEFSPGACTVVGRRSEHALYDLSLATYGSEDAFDQRHAEGFVKLWGLPLKVWSTRQGGLEQRGDGPRGEGSRS